MRIAVYCPHYEDLGGVQEVVRRLSRGLATRGHAVAIVARRPSGSSAPLSAIDPGSGAEMIRLRLVRTPHPALGTRAYRHFAHHFPPAALRLVGLVRARHPDLIVTHCSKFHAPYVLALRALVRVPIVVHLHNGPRTADGPESPRLQRLLERCATRIIAVSEPVAEYARAVLPGRAERIVAIPNGVDAGELADVPAARRDRPYVLGVGRLAPEKGFDLLVDAMATVDRGVDLVLAGDGAEREALLARAAVHGLDGRLHVLGQVDRRTVAALMRGACVVAMPSRFEGFPLVCLEAMQAGAPIVASRLPVFPSALRNGHTGLLVPPDDSPALAAALTSLLESPDRAAALGRAARDAARGFPDWDTITARVLVEYTRALAGQPA